MSSPAVTLGRRQQIVLDGARRVTADHPKLVRAAMWVVAAIVCLLRSWQLGVDSNFDLQMYHLYKATSVLDGGLFDDVAVAGLGTYLNPLIDVPFGITVGLFGPDRGLLVGVAVVQFACYVAVWRLVRALAGADHRAPVAGVVMFGIAITGSCAVSIAFTTFGDWVVTAALCEAFTRLVAIMTADGSRSALLRRNAVLMGVWTGLAVGLKLTSAPIAIGIGAAALVVAPRRAWLPALAGSIGAFAVSAGPWMMYLQWRYGSPLFPFYNDYFNAPSALTNQNIKDGRFGTKTIRGIAEFPAEMMRGTVKYSEWPFQDWRYLGVLGLLAAWACIDWRAAVGDRLVRAAFVSLVVSYLVWAVQFGIYRYFLFGEVLISAMIVLLAFRLWALRRTAMAVVAAMWVVGLGFTQAPDWGRDLRLQSDTLDTALAATVTEPVVVLISAPPPMSYLLEEFPSSTKAISLWAMNGGGVLYTAQIREETDELVDEGLAEDGLYAIVDTGTTVLMSPLEAYRLLDCAAFDGNGRPLELCRVAAP